MPELPEVEAAAQRLRSATIGRSIADARVLHPAIARGLPPRSARRLRGRTIVGVDRRGKHQLVRLDDGRTLHIHFRMAGDWAFARSDDATPSYARLLLELSDGTRIALVDSRALSTATLLDDDASLPPLGLEATDPSLDAGALASALSGRRAPIKTALLDQRAIAGLGNIYAAEALWHARIDPRSPAASLGPARLARLAEGIRATLEIALASPGRYSSGDSAPLHVYDREGEPCDRCGRPVRRLVQAGRSTYFCARCQR